MAFWRQRFCDMDNNIPINQEMFKSGTKINETAETVMGISYTLVGMAAVFGNLCALYYFITVDRKNRFTASRILYTAFAATDLLMGIVSCWSGLVFGKGRPFYLCSILDKSKPVNNIIGTISNFSMFAGANVIALMAVSRCVGVFLPFKFKHIFTPVASCVMLGMVLLHPVVVALLPFFVTNLETETHDYMMDLPSGQILYYLYHITKENPRESLDVTHRLNIGFVVFPRLFAVVTMVLSSVAVAVKLLLYRAPTQSNNSNANSNRNTSITLLILAAVFFVTIVPFCFISIVDVAGKTDDLGLTAVAFYLVPSCYLVAFVSSAVNPLVYQLRGRSIFEKRKRTGTVYVNHMSRQETTTRLSVLEESKI